MNQNAPLAPLAIRPIREARGWTQEQLAVYAGITRQTLVRLETESEEIETLLRTQVSTLYALAAALEVSVLDLAPGLGWLTRPRDGDDAAA